MQSMFNFVHNYAVACHFSDDELEILLILFSSEYGISG
jgi:hypothetical protein